MKEYIEKAALIAAMKSGVSPLFNLSSDAGRMYLDMLERVQNFPAADVAEGRHGRWNPEIHHTYIPVEYDQNGDPILHEYTSFRCSLCGREEPKEEPYCHCGARMGKEADHEVSE